MKTPDKFGRDYTVYVSEKEEVEEPQSKRKDAAPSRKPAKKSKGVPAKGEKEDLPF